jgi:dihydroneopterin aldolase
VQKQQAVLVEARLKQEARIAELEAKLAELEPYRTFIEQIRKKVRKEEYDE